VNDSHTVSMTKSTYGITNAVYSFQHSCVINYVNAEALVGVYAFYCVNALNGA
jgi:hypothetical protein